MKKSSLEKREESTIASENAVTALLKKLGIYDFQPFPSNYLKIKLQLFLPFKDGRQAKYSKGRRKLS